MKRRTLLIAFSLIISMLSFAKTPLWMRNATISPDGQFIAFCYKGDIYKVSAQGGAAIQLTTQDSYETSPIWSPDSKHIAFASDRKGNFDIYLMSANGGSAKALTMQSTNEHPTSFSFDGNYVLFNASIQDPAESALFPSGAMSELYQVPVKGGRISQLLGTPAENVHYSKDGKFFLYQDQKGFEDTWRKHHTSSITRDIWMYDVAAKQHTNLTNRAGEDRNPVLSADGKTVYFLSERNGGSFNLYRFDVNNPAKVETVTHFKTHPVRFLSISNQDKLCFTYDGSIYTLQPGKKPVKVAIDIVRDDIDEVAILHNQRGVKSASVSPDGKQIAFSVRGEIFVSSVEYGTTKQITHTAAAESQVCWGKDNRTLVYASERDGIWNLYKATIERDEEKTFPNATLIKEEALFSVSQIDRTYPQYSPDGKELAFIEGRKILKVMNLKTKKIRQITDESTWFRTDGGFTYTWSPDGKWFSLEFIGHQHDPYTDIGLVSAQGGKIENLTGSGYFSSSPRWVLDGNAILFGTDRYGMRAHASWGSLYDMMLVFVNQDAYDKFRLSKEDYELQKELEKEQKQAKEKAEKENAKDKKKKDTKPAKDSVKAINVELEGIQDRIIRLTPNSSNILDAIIDAKGETLYYTSAFESGYDLWKLDLRDRDPQLCQKGAGYGMFEADKKGAIFMLGNAFKKLEGGRLKSLQYNATMKLDKAAEREYMFNHVYRQERERFYIKTMHGVDWEGLTKDYRKFLPHINNNYDFADMLSEWLGELNVSHTGAMYHPRLYGENTANLGLLFDWKYNGKGLRIAEVIKKGPFNHANSEVEAGTILEKIDNVEIDDNIDYTSLLQDKTGKKVLVSLYNPVSKKRWEEVVKPISNGMFRALLYNRWVKQRAADVERLSGGRLGYVHIQSMNDDSFRDVYSDILGKYNKCEGIVIDTRFNGGGRLHEDIEILFSGKKYFTQVVRGHESCDMPSRRWNKPSIMVTCEANYSNAHGTPWVYQHQKLGKVVGAPVAGTMTSVSWETLQDPSLVFGIPVIGYRLPDGSYLENTQLEPDILVLNKPELIVKGEDTQLKVAVEALLKQIDEQK